MNFTYFLLLSASWIFVKAVPDLTNGTEWDNDVVPRPADDTSEDGKPLQGGNVEEPSGYDDYGDEHQALFGAGSLSNELFWFPNALESQFSDHEFIHMPAGPAAGQRCGLIEDGEMAKYQPEVNPSTQSPNLNLQIASTASSVHAFGSQMLFGPDMKPLPLKRPNRKSAQRKRINRLRRRDGLSIA